VLARTQSTFSSYLVVNFGGTATEFGGARTAATKRGLRCGPHDYALDLELLVAGMSPLTVSNLIFLHKQTF
jgi:hypothetical protein